MSRGAQISGKLQSGLDPAARTDISKDAETTTVLRSLCVLSTGEKHAVGLETDEDVPTWSDIHTPWTFPPAGTASVLCCGPVWHLTVDLTGLGLGPSHHGKSHSEEEPLDHEGERVHAGAGRERGTECGAARRSWEWRVPVRRTR